MEQLISYINNWVGLLEEEKPRFNVDNHPYKCRLLDEQISVLTECAETMMSLQVKVAELEAKAQKSVELPCDIGCDVWVISNDKTQLYPIVYGKVEHMEIHKNNRIMLLIYFYNSDGKSYFTHLAWNDEIGKTVFFRKEQAEQCFLKISNT